MPASTPPAVALSSWVLYPKMEPRSSFCERFESPGISVEGQKKLFQVFSQVEESTTREYEGTGLGLALVKSLLKRWVVRWVLRARPERVNLLAEFPVIESVAQKVVKPLLIVEDDEATLTQLWSRSPRS